MAPVWFSIYEAAAQAHIAHTTIDGWIRQRLLRVRLAINSNNRVARRVNINQVRQLIEQRRNFYGCNFKHHQPDPKPETTPPPKPDPKPTGGAAHKYRRWPEFRLHS